MRKLQITMFILLSFLFITSHEAAGIEKNKKFKYDLAVCAIFRNEAPYLKEWIEFHRLVGVEHFYLYNNLSSDNYKKVLKHYIENNIVTLIDWSFQYKSFEGWPPIQCSAYHDAMEKAQGTVKWMAVLDTDEFLFPIEHDHLQDFLKDYEEFGAVCANWQMYGTSHVPKIPSKKLLIETLHLKAPKDFGENQHVKSIVQPLKFAGCPSPHVCYLKPGCYQVNENKERFDGSATPCVSVNKIRVNHYWSRDENFFNRVKIQRRESWNEHVDGQMKRLNMLNSDVDDGAIQRFVPALRKKIFGKKS